mgnify:CR=1 FL=1
MDTGATLTKIPRTILEELGVKPVAKRKFELGDGREIERDIGFAIIKIKFNDKEYMTACSVAFGEDEEEPLLGAVTLEGMGLGVDPVRKKLIEITFLEKLFASSKVTSLKWRSWVILFRKSVSTYGL